MHTHISSSEKVVLCKDSYDLNKQDKAKSISS